ncbi:MULTISPECIES: hypothetical protein [unclassified Streptomyces]|uniref:hypothetical protein n=1 Tax=unclassified Streptomyces TaxID=2593676 RepID=UPI002E800B01|nr:hypothetical protein [Streptomyces sp. NBC_00523]WUC98387.1 hypothetical protein OHS17_01430 [Streptomyces sp. NBC_00523]
MGKAIRGASRGKTGYLVGRLSSEQRSELLDLLGMMAESESDPARREFLEGFPESFGLLDDAVRPVHRPGRTSGA